MAVMIRDLWSEYEAAHGHELATLTAKKYQNVGSLMERQFGGSRPVASIKRAEAAAWKAKMSRRGLSPATVAKTLAIAKLLTREMVDQDRLERNPFDRIRVYAPPPDGEWPILTVEQVHAIMDQCNDLPGLKTCFALTGLCGLRVSQAISLRWRNVNFEKNRIAVDAQTKRRSTKHRLHYPPIEPSKAPSGMMEYLRVTRGDRGDHALVCGVLPQRTVRERAKAAIQRAVDAGAIPAYPKPFHGLRRSCAARWAMLYPEHVVAAWLGHSLVVSMRHYRSVDEAVYAIG